MVQYAMKSRSRNKYLLKIFLYSLIPWTLILISSIGIYRIMLVKYENEIIERYEQTNKALAAELDLVFSGAAHTGYVLINSPTVSDIERRNPGKNIINTSMRELIELRTLFSDTAIINDIIESLFFYLPEADMVLHSKGTESADLFFSTTNNLENYPGGFWTKIGPINTSYRILDPVIKKKGTPQESRVIPIVIPKVSSNYYITMLLHEKFIIQILENHHITSNTSISIITIEGDEIIRSGTSAPFVSHKERQYLEGQLFLGDQLFTLRTAFPRSDIVNLTYNVRLIMIVTTILLAVLSSFISFLLSRNVSKPVEGLIELMKKKALREPGEAEGIKFLQQGVEDLLQSSETLNRNLSDTTAIAIENYMERLILDRRTANPWLTIKKLKNYSFEFPFSYFQIVLVRLDPADQLFSKLTEEDISLFYQGAMDVITHGFPKKLRLWQIGFEEHTIRILVNVPGNTDSNCLVPNFISFISVFSTDDNLKNITIGMGRIHANVENIHTSYNEAGIALAKASKEQPNSVLLYTNEKIKQEFILPEQDINKFSDDLMLGKSSHVLHHLDEILKANNDIGISEKILMKLFFRIYMIIQQVIQTKKLMEEDIMGSGYIGIPLQYNNLTVGEFLDYLRKLIPATAKTIIPDSFYKIEKNDIEEFLEENFSKDISLDDLAERYKTTPAYVSKCFKKLFGIPLTSYLAEKRISFASYLLTEMKNLSIEEIGTICGFNNRIHFTRSFKKRRGVPPTEYRRKEVS